MPPQHAGMLGIHQGADVTKPEERARQQIDQQLTEAGWTVQSEEEMNLSVGLGQAIREYPITGGRCDYLLFVGRRAVGVVEAKKEDTLLSSVSEQTARYLRSVPARVARFTEPLPFGYESTGKVTYFRDLRDPDSASRRVFSFHRPETLLEWVSQPSTLRDRLRRRPEFTQGNLRDCQFEAVSNLETSLAQSKPRALVQMATGSGKTFAAITSAYRLIKYAGARRILFLVDRGNLGRQALQEFQAFTTPDDGRKFTELYNVQHLTSNTPDSVAKVHISTIQRLYSMLRGEADLDPGDEEHSSWEMAGRNQRPRDVAYSAALPPEYYDFIIVDECHRSIYNVWRQVLEYFDAFLIGLTATPSKLTIAFFNQNLVMEYTYEQSVVDGVNVGYDVYRIKTEVGERGAHVEANPNYLRGIRDKRTHQVRWEELDEDLTYTAQQLDRSVVNESTIRTILRAIRDHLPTELFPGRTEVPKMLIFAKDDSHAEDIVRIAREEFGKGNDFCKKITYSAERPEEILKSFTNDYYPRIAVTVDMIATGTDVRSLECLVFMRDVKSQNYYDQMKGRGVRTVSDAELRSVTPDAEQKRRFILVDAVGVTESFKKNEPKLLDRKKSVPFGQLLRDIQTGSRDDDSLTSLATRLTRLHRDLTPADQAAVRDKAGGLSLPDLARQLLASTDPDHHLQHARETTGDDEPSETQVEEARATLVESACQPFDSPALRTLLTDLQKRSEQVMDVHTLDRVTYFGLDERAAKQDVQTFREFIEKHRDELSALQLILNTPYRDRHVTLRDIRNLADTLTREYPRLTPEYLWHAYAKLEGSRVRGTPAQVLSNIVSLVRFATGAASTLVPYPDTVAGRFEAWLAAQEGEGRLFTPEQQHWLTMIRDHIATSLTIEQTDFEYTPFSDEGGEYRARKVFPDLDDLIRELNDALAA